MPTWQNYIRIICVNLVAICFANSISCPTETQQIKQQCLVPANYRVTTQKTLNFLDCSLTSKVVSGCGLNIVMEL